ncbi:hypothetical protein N7468_002445 [Penicillium chermesinum]|uniref:Uncharacterized protein n=1 Tax=Penicillium chermesinum TaxID=63820 RepID=A0A9W9TXZ7_9EURO|nr:uncharacterized protein N7468_002445 [Penicillium chermesinum]KAJ5247462.1 hypothetical protein N7468_002445 [Penicillium chermesinum]KAJ6145700.1 hypothetical protein N7470_009595 [Penicillium chermesinum]
MTDQTYHTTRQDLRKPESRVAHQHGGTNPSDSEVSAMKSIVDKNSVDKNQKVEEVKSNLPLPDQPPVASDWNSSDQRTVNVGSGGISGSVSGEGDSALREPATAESSVRVDGSDLHKNTEPASKVGRQGKEGLDGLPSDALAR